jgi:hypothetical protein
MAPPGVLLTTTSTPGTALLYKYGGFICMRITYYSSSIITTGTALLYKYGGFVFGS